jgi:hypothetical protein
MEKTGVIAEHGIARWRVFMPNDHWGRCRRFSVAARHARRIYAFTATAQAVSK